MKLNSRFYPCFLLIFFVVAGCNSSKQGDDGYDDARKRAGLPLVPGGWLYVRDAPNMAHWYRPSNGPTPPYTYYQKWIELTDGKVRKEENLYVGKEKYVSGKDTLVEDLMVGAYFAENKDVVRWDIVYKGPVSPFLRLTKPQADSVLMAWGIEHK